MDGAYLGGDWLHHPGLHGRTRVLEIIETQKQKQDDHLQQPGDRHDEEQTTLSHHPHRRPARRQLHPRHADLGQDRPAAHLRGGRGAGQPEHAVVT